MNALYLMQALIKRKWSEPPYSWIITNGVHAVEHVKDLSVEQIPVWGLSRVMISENPDIKTRMLDLSSILLPAAYRNILISLIMRILCWRA